MIEDRRENGREKSRRETKTEDVGLNDDRRRYNREKSDDILHPNLPQQDIEPEEDGRTSSLPESV